MPELLVVVLALASDQVRAGLASVDGPGELVRESVVPRGEDLPAAVAAALQALALSADEAPRLLALAVAVGADVDAQHAAGLLQALQDEDSAPGELADGWPLPGALPVVAGHADAWAAAGAVVPAQPLVAGAVVAAARSVGAHAHLPGG